MNNVEITQPADADTITPLGQDVGLRLCRVLQEPTCSLTRLHFEWTRLEDECIAFLVAGLCDNGTLEVLNFFNCTMRVRAVVEILESLLVNHTLKDLAFKGIAVAGSSDSATGAFSSNTVASV
jgi:hypothetical protein